MAEGLTKVYHGHEAVRDVGLRLEPGRIVGLVGANGAGKTTTIKMLCGLLEPTRGTAQVDGRATLEPAARRDIGYLPEDSPLYDDETPQSYLAFFAGLYDIPRSEARERARALLVRLRLPETHWKRPIGTLSKGQKRKVAIARALLHSPQILILDEPTSGLDPLTAAELEEFVRELRSQEKALLLSAHNLRQVEELCDEILVMHMGRIVARGTLAALRGRFGTSRYLVRGTTAFRGSQPRGSLHEGAFTNMGDVETALHEIRVGKGMVLEVESVPPKLEDIVRRAAEA